MPAGWRSLEPPQAARRRVAVDARAALAQCRATTTAFGLPLVKPPYGRVTAINMNTGDHVWMQPIGNTPENIKNHPMLKGVTIPKTRAAPAARASW